jgi:hypothetical protein
MFGAPAVLAAAGTTAVLADVLAPPAPDGPAPVGKENKGKGTAVD